MGAPVWSHMYVATGERKYVDYLDEQWKKTSELLYDPQEHLFARDKTYLTKTEPNGKKMFWSRGNGWVMGGIARILDELPPDDPRRAFYVTQLQEMAARVAQLQGPDGLWHAGLLDPKTYPLPEVSGSAFFTYAIAFGIDHGILDAKTFRPVVERAWRGMLGHVYADGRLGDIQQTGSEPAFYMPTASYTYGVGAYLLAGAEIKKMIAEEGQKGPTDPILHAKLNLPVPANPKLPTLFLVGDSTVRNGHGDGAQGQWGWGEPLVRYFDPGKVNVVNRAIGGRSSRTYITEGHWADVLGMMKRGDVVLLQFGHNDSGPLDDTARARGTIPGVGDETKEIENPILKRHETVHSYGWYMAKYVEDAKAKGATVIVCSPIPRKIWKDGKVERNSANYGGWAKQTAEKEHVGFIDLDEIIAAKYDALGEAKVEALFADPHTHTSLAGAELNAESVVEGLKRLKNDPVAKDFSAKGLGGGTLRGDGRPEPGGAADAAGVSVGGGEEWGVEVSAEGVGADEGGQVLVDAVDAGDAAAEDDDVRVQGVDDLGEAAGEAVFEAVECGCCGGIAGVVEGGDLAGGEALAGGFEEVAGDGGAGDPLLHAT